MLLRLQCVAVRSSFLAWSERQWDLPTCRSYDADGGFNTFLRTSKVDIIYDCLYSSDRFVRFSKPAVSFSAINVVSDSYECTELSPLISVVTGPSAGCPRGIYLASVCRYLILLHPTHV